MTGPQARARTLQGSVDAAGGRDAGRVKILRFVDGLRYAHHTPAGDVMREYDEMLLDLYGAPRFHELRIPVTG